VTEGEETTARPVQATQVEACHKRFADSSHSDVVSRVRLDAVDQVAELLAPLGVGWR
jgi:hypothetical protein